MLKTTSINNKYKVYFELDDDNNIIKIFSDAFEKPDELKIAVKKQYFIDEGYGDKFRHAQNLYFPTALFDGLGNPIYKYDRMSRAIIKNESIQESEVVQ